MTKRKLFVHVGHAKTGSSAIQSWLAKSTDRLQALGVHYPAPKNKAGAVSGEISSGNGLQIMDGTARTFDDACDYLWSSESLFPWFRSAGKQAQFASEFEGQLKIIVYTRDLFSMAFSSYGQKVKRGHKHGIHSLDEWIKSHFGHHLKTLQTYMDSAPASGAELCVMNYSRHRNNLISSFLDSILGENDAKQLLKEVPLTSQSVNRSLTLGELELQRLFNVHSKEPTSRFISDLLVNQLPDVKGERPGIRKSTYDECVQNLGPTVKRINAGLSAQEAIRIESYEELQSSFSAVKENSVHLSQAQLETIVAGLCDELDKRVTSLEAKELFRLAKVAGSEMLSTSDRIFLLELAQRARPQGPFIQKAIDELSEP